jgi:poly-beta-1,6-N-acetyl-D-glucosamine synthase
MGPARGSPAARIRGSRRHALRTYAWTTPPRRLTPHVSSFDDEITVPDGDPAYIRPPRERFGGRTRREPPIWGLRPTVRFTIAFPLTLAWVAFSVWVSEPWREDLEIAVGPVMGWVVPLFLAYIPGLVIGFMVFTLLITRYRELPLEPPKGDWPEGEWPSVTIVVAAWNESDAIVRTLEDIAELTYQGHVEVVVADNNSTDDTALLADAAGDRLALHYRRVFEAKQGKNHVLNAALATVTTPLLVTLDADTHPHRESLTRLAVRVTSTPQDQHVSACAAALVAENPLATFVTRMQQWDYRLGINGVKRMQAAYNTALVAQGAFSAYWTSDLRAVGGWPDAIGEDIVLTWTMLGSRGIVQYEPVALGFTVVPERLDRLLNQRSRWARGMLEGLRANPPPKQPRVLAKVVAGIDYLVPFLDIGVIFFWVPGVILFLFGYPLIFGWWSMLLLPITVAVFGFLQRWQASHVFRTLDIHPHSDKRGFLGYLFAYQVLTSAAALRGYGQYLVGSNRRWK